MIVDTFDGRIIEHAEGGGRCIGRFFPVYRMGAKPEDLIIQ